MYLLDVFMNEWVLEGKDVWIYWNYNHGGVGFPRDCGTRGTVGSQWIFFIRSGSNATNHPWCLTSSDVH
ncbi:hypothetical protein ACHAWF_015668 [Thalassiosira exigua]